MVSWVASGQLAAVSADGAESQEGWILRVVLPWLNGGVPGPRWAAWPVSQTILFLLDLSQIDYSFLTCSEQMLNAANQPSNQQSNRGRFLVCIVIPALTATLGSITDTSKNNRFAYANNFTSPLKTQLLTRQ
jgi:hypothetical protein